MKNRPPRIGVLTPLTPPGWVEAGRQLLAGLQLAVSDVNSAGGIDGCPLELIVRDTAADPAKASVAVEEFARLGVAAVAGEYHSVVARFAAAKADALGLPFLCSSAVLDTLTEKPSPWVARLAAAQSRGWRIYADHLLEAGHMRIALARQASIYWDSGARVLREAFAAQGGSIIDIDAGAHNPRTVCDELFASGATALLILAGYPEPAAALVGAVRRDPRLAGILIGAPAGQPEFASWASTLGDAGAGVPFLRYMPDRLGTLGTRVEMALLGKLADAPSFVAFEGYDTIVVLAQAMRSCGMDRARIAEAWPSIETEGTRGTIRFSKVPGIDVWQWAWPPIQVVDRDPSQIDGLRVLRTG